MINIFKSPLKPIFTLALDEPDHFHPCCEHIVFRQTDRR